MAVFVLNFQSPKDIDELRWAYENTGHTNLDELLEDARNFHETTWTVPSNSNYGDTVIFTCARTAQAHIGHARAQVKAAGETELMEFADEQTLNYKKYAGKIIATGMIGEMPWKDQDSGDRTYWAKIVKLQLAEELIDISEFKGSIQLSKFSAHTKLNGWQWQLLRQRIEKGNANG